MSVLTQIAVFQTECPTCDSKISYVWVNTTEVRSDGLIERRIECPLCECSIKHDPINKMGYQAPGTEVTL